jgi:hypothetical protein
MLGPEFFVGSLMCVCVCLCACMCMHEYVYTGIYDCMRVHMNVQEISGRMRAEPIPLQLQVNKAVLTKDRSVCTYLCTHVGCSNLEVFNVNKPVF